MALKLGPSFGRPQAAKPNARPARSPTYHAVAVLPSRDACEQARAAKGKRVLADDAPMLPLADCDRATHCSCRYQHYADRRGQPRRQADRAPPSPDAAGHTVERRSPGGRRAEDRLDFDVAADEPRDDHTDTYFAFHGKS